MKIWAISDLHFSTGPNRMVQYGTVWNDHTEIIRSNWRTIVSQQDIVLVTGDLSWSRPLPMAMIDLKKFSDLPGKAKLIVKGNHDLWWKDIYKLRKIVPSTVIPLEGSAVHFDDQVFCGTQAWISPNDPYFDPLDQKFFEKELILLKDSLEEALKFQPKDGIHLLMHFPPFTSRGLTTPFFDLLKQYPVITCTYGHFHRPEEWEKIPKGLIDGIHFQLASTDYLNHTPVCVWEEN